MNVSRRGHRRKEQPKITSKINLCYILCCILKNLYILLFPSEILFLACFQQINRKLHTFEIRKQKNFVNKQKCGKFQIFEKITDFFRIVI